MNKKVGDCLDRLYYLCHKKGMIGKSYNILFENWPSITKRLGLKEDEFEKPIIDITQEYSEYDQRILIFFPTLFMAYRDKKIEEYGLDIDCVDLLERDIIHECVHYMQDQFYNIDSDDYRSLTEGLAELVSVEILLEKEKYNIAAASIAEHFMDMKKEYKDYFGLPEEYNKHIERIIKDDSCKPPERTIHYASGFLHICEKYRKRKNYRGLLRRPFKNSDVT